MYNFIHRIMKRVRLQTEHICDWPTFHQQFKEQFGFPDYYGSTMDAWVECMSHLTTPDSGRTSLVLDNGELLAIEIAGSESFYSRCGEQLAALVEYSAEVNRRYIESGNTSAIAFLFR